MKTSLYEINIYFACTLQYIYICIKLLREVNISALKCNQQQ